MNDKQLEISSFVDSLDDFLENSLCGFLTTTYDGIIIRANSKITEWTGLNQHEIIGKRFPDLLNIAGKIYYDTHLWPLLRMQKYFDEVALELVHTDGSRLQVLVNAYERRDTDESPQFIRLTVLKATDRRLYEQGLKDAKAIAEQQLSNVLELSALKDQFIAILGHDLRNPLGSITMGTAVLSQLDLGEKEKKITQVISRSAARMAELINNIMDFARTRLGGGIVLERTLVDIEPVLGQVVDELKIIWPGRIIITEFDISEQVYCDADRISQILSNLLTNAITHGASDKPVKVYVSHQSNEFILSITNQGNPIPQNHFDNLFQPFTREGVRPSQNGLGLGLYIASEIARAHGGMLSVTSDAEETKFTFKMLTNKS